MPVNFRPFLTEITPSLPIPANGDRTCSPAFDQSLMAALITPSCKGAICFVSPSDNCFVCRFRVSDSSTQSQIG